VAGEPPVADSGNLLSRRHALSAVKVITLRGTRGIQPYEAVTKWSAMRIMLNLLTARNSDLNRTFPVTRQ